MILLGGGRDTCCDRVAIGQSPIAPKERSGDHKAPEGIYRLDDKNAKSGFHLAMYVSYPHSLDRQRSAKQGVTAGSEFMMHGLKNGFGWIGRFHRRVDWTDSCIALTNSEMDPFRKLVPDGTPVEIRPRTMPVSSREILANLLSPPAPPNSDRRGKTVPQSRRARANTLPQS